MIISRVVLSVENTNEWFRNKKLITEDNKCNYRKGNFKGARCDYKTINNEKKRWQLQRE